MSSRTLILLLVAVAAGAVLYVVGRILGHTLLFLPLFMFWSWGDRRRRPARDGEATQRRLSHTDGAPLPAGELKDDLYRHPADPATEP